MKRLADWQQRFWQFMHVSLHAPFELGRHDCILFSASMIDAITGAHFFEDVKHAYPYSNESEAALLLQGGLRILIEKHLGPSIQPSRCDIGDVVLIKVRDGAQALCVHDGMQLVMAAGRRLRSVRFELALCGWTI